MLNLVLAVICVTGNSLTLKLAEKKTGNRIMLLLVNYVVTFCFGLVFLQNWLVRGTMNGLKGSIALMVIMGVINGILYILTYFLLQINIRKNGATISASLSHMGLLIPIILSVFVFSEYPDGSQIAGTITSLAAIALISIPINKEDDVLKKARLLLIPMLICSGMADMMSKFFEAYCPAEQESAFMQITFSVSLLICMVSAAETGEKLNRYDILYGLFLGIFNYMSVKFLIGALYVLPAFYVYACYGIGGILLINLINAAILHERLTKIDTLSMLLMAMSIVLLNW